MPSLSETDPDLIQALRALADTYGLQGVRDTAEALFRQENARPRPCIRPSSMLPNHVPHHYTGPADETFYCPGVAPLPTNQ